MNFFTSFLKKTSSFKTISNEVSKIFSDFLPECRKIQEISEPLKMFQIFFWLPTSCKNFKQLYKVTNLVFQILFDLLQTVKNLRSCYIMYTFQIFLTTYKLQNNLKSCEYEDTKFLNISVFQNLYYWLPKSYKNIPIAEK